MNATIGFARRLLAFGTTAPLAPYATQVYPELPAALALTVAIAALTGARQPRHLVVAAARIDAVDRRRSAVGDVNQGDGVGIRRARGLLPHADETGEDEGGAEERMVPVHRTSRRIRHRSPGDGRGATE